MTHIYLFNKEAFASEYGIGTYIRQLTECLQNCENISLTIVQLFCSNKNEFVIEESEMIRTIYCPRPVTSTPNILEKYHRNVWHLIYPYIQVNNHDKLIFHLNYDAEYPLLEKMKQDFPSCQTIFTIHYQEWCFKLKGNTSYFKHIIHKRKEEIIDDEEKEVVRSYDKEKKLYAFVDKIICLSDYTKQLLIDEYQISSKKIVKIYNGLSDEGVILNECAKNELKKKLGFAKKDKIILFVGRIDEIKGIDVLIKSFNQIATEYSNYKLVVIGNGKLASKCMQDINDCWGKIHFTGRLEKNILYKFYQIA